MIKLKKPGATRKLLNALVGVAVGAVLSVSAQAQEKFTAASVAGTISIVAQVATAKGYFAEEGLDLEIKYLQGGNRNIKALAGGSAMFAQASDAQFVSGLASGLPLVAIGVHSRGFPARLLVSKENSDLKTLAELKGKNIGLLMGTGAHTVMTMAIENQGMTEADFTLSNIRPNEMAVAMNQNAFDAVLIWNPEARNLQQLGLADEVISPRQFEKMAGVNVPQLTMTTAETIANNPELVQKYVNAIIKSLNFIDNNRDEVVDIYRKAFPLDLTSKLTDEQILHEIYGTYSFSSFEITEQDEADVNSMGRFLLKKERIKAMPDIAASLNRSLFKK